MVAHFQLRGETPELSVTVFTSPSPLSVGPADINVLLQKRETLEPVLDAEVLIVMRPIASGREVRARATREQAQNKLLFAAPLTLGESYWSYLAFPPLMALLFTVRERLYDITSPFRKGRYAQIPGADEAPNYRAHSRLHGVGFVF